MDILIIKILAPLTDNPVPQDTVNGETALHSAAFRGYTEIVQILAPLTSNPNASNIQNRVTPIHLAAENGHTKIVKILTSLTSNPITSTRLGDTPIHYAAQNGHTEIIKLILINEEVRRIFTSSKKYNASGKPSKKRAKKF